MIFWIYYLFCIATGPEAGLQAPLPAGGEKADDGLASRARGGAGTIHDTPELAPRRVPRSAAAKDQTTKTTKRH